MPDGVVYGAWIDYDAQEALRVLRFDPSQPNASLERLPQWYLPNAGPRVQGGSRVTVQEDGALRQSAELDGAPVAGDDRAEAVEARRVGREHRHPRLGLA